ncbi:hypothetical protein CGZ93_02875 [Enemella dayhoffiae]|uniref:Cell division protein FtsL n=1 Tax=Enemella dayhoffiae TaxID=2016507 RepID=A0A255H9Z4_9ACTN|nr:hypothetical protein [Enemella dayhoffiae]OYO24658.1 hypothetical protein CGZ93_02875 [Enemella dayhoffiae]
MSAQTTVTAPQPERRSRRPRLEVVAPPQRRLSTIPFVVVLAAVLGAGMIGLLLLNTSLQNQAFEASQLRRQAAELHYAEVELDQRVIDASSARELTRKASEQGMRPNFFIGFVLLPEGRIVGDPKAADQRYLPSAVTRTEEEQAQLRAEKAVADGQKRVAEERKKLEANQQRLRDEQAKQKAAAEKAAAEQAARDAAARPPAPNPAQPNPAQNNQARPNQPQPTQGSR